MYRHDDAHPNGRPALGPTLAYPPKEAAPESRPRPRCRFARLSGPTTDSRGELRGLLYTRLRAASLIALVPFLYFLARRVFDVADHTGGMPLTDQAVGVGVTAVLTAWIWLRRLRRLGRAAHRGAGPVRLDRRLLRLAAI